MSKAAPADSAGVRQFTVRAEDDGIRLDRWFKRHMPDATFAIVSRWARTGQLRVDGARATPGDRVAEGQVLRVPPLDASAVAGAKTTRPRPILTEEQMDFAESLIIHRDPQAIVINKPPGLATQGGTKTHEHVDGLLDALMFEKDDRPRLVHRLDKDTSGALLLARTSRSAAHFAKSFSSRTARKVYWAIVLGTPQIEDGFIDLPLAKQPGTGGEKMHVDEAEGLPARTRYRIIERAGNRASWIELQPHTGRTHQLRVHMAYIGHPIVGDGKYGGKEAFLSGSISRKMHLHARRIRIDHPDGTPLDVYADLPHHFAETLLSLGFDLNEGDLPLQDEIQVAPGERKAAEKRAAAAYSKDLRKARRGERRGRSGGPEKAGRPERSDRPGRPDGRSSSPGAARSGGRAGSDKFGGPRTGGRADGEKPAGPRSGSRSGGEGFGGPRTGDRADSERSGGARSGGPRSGGRPSGEGFAGARTGGRGRSDGAGASRPVSRFGSDSSGESRSGSRSGAEGSGPSRSGGRPGSERSGSSRPITRSGPGSDRSGSDRSGAGRSGSRPGADKSGPRKPRRG